MAQAPPVESDPSVKLMSYARFAKRNLDKMSWLAPLVNTPAGDLFNIELRHEQLFFVQGDRVVEDVGYSEKGKRFSEAEYGKVIGTVDELKKFGYWFVGRTYDPDIMREALRRQRDDYYYSFFSNQCQDWADRLKRVAERIERERGVALPRRRILDRAEPEATVLPTEPASIWMGLVALALGVGGFIAPVVAGGAFTLVLGILLLAAGLSNIVYALHAKDWKNLPPELLVGLVNIGTAVLLFWNRELARTAGGLIIAVALAVHGAINLVLGLFSRPRSHWSGKVVAGVLMLVCAALIAVRWPSSGERLLGATVGLSLLAGGIGTIWLSWKTRTSV